MKHVLTLTLCLLLAAFPTAKNLRVLVVTTTPQMHCDSCEKKIQNHLRFEKGVVKVATDRNAQRVTITYNADKTNAETIMRSFSKIDYQVKCLSDNAVTAKTSRKAAKTEASPTTH